jgi:hypothetical protein
MCDWLSLRNEARYAAQAVKSRYIAEFHSIQLTFNLILHHKLPTRLGVVVVTLGLLISYP